MGDDRVKNEAMEIMGLFQLLPRLVVFDLDYTLWPFYCECRSKREMPKLYPQAKGILSAFKDKGVDIAIASRSPTPDIANTFLEKLGIRSWFVAQEIFSSWTHKTDHFQRINRRTIIPYNEMLFFDDEDRNIDAKLAMRKIKGMNNQISSDISGISIQDHRNHKAFHNSINDRFPNETSQLHHKLMR
ncbi:hypothetical protein DH2020_030598 [Rehmannia glutinosa]|uniref:Magnesium-dependent phosphatase n=1 Tax=Rehmannia glutinosa TaxID=99300 RepID=A0ABR0VMX0_REHGL